MTVEKQDIKEDFYQGDYKAILVSVFKDKQLTQVKDLAGAESVDWALTDRKDGTIYLQKSTLDGDTSIKITDAGNGKVEVYLWPVDTASIYGTFRHQMQITDVDGKPECVMTGTVNIFRSYARRLVRGPVSAYLQGG